MKAMLAWEWTLEKARDGEGEVEKKATTTRKISQTAQVQRERSSKKQAFSSLKMFDAILSVLGTLERFYRSGHKSNDGYGSTVTL